MCYTQLLATVFESREGEKDRETKREGGRRRERERERGVPATLIMTSLFGISSTCLFPLLSMLAPSRVYSQHDGCCDWSMSICVSISLATGVLVLSCIPMKKECVTTLC